MTALLADLRLAVRALSRSGTFATVVVLTLGVSIGATTAVFSVVEGVLLRPLPFDRPDQLVRPTWDRTVRAGWPFNAMGLTLLEQRSRSYSSFGVHGSPQSVTIMLGAEPEQVEILPVDAGFWSTLGVVPSLGRTFTEEEDVPGGPILAILSEGFWMEHFAGDRTAIGSTLELNGFPVEIIGVAPGSLRYPFPEVDVYASARIDRTSTNINHSWYVVARLRDGTTPEEADRELESLVSALPEVGYPPDFARLFTGTGSVPTLREHVVGPVRTPLMTLLAVSGFVLLIGCVNVANLLLVRGSQRTGQAVVRRALGATRWQMARYVLSESLVLALAGGLLGVLVAWLGVRGLLALQPASIPRLELVSVVSPVVLLYCTAVALTTALLFGAVPALETGSVRAAGVVRGGASSGGGRSARRLSHALVVLETAVALVVVVASLLLVRSAAAVRDVDTGFESANRLVYRTSAIGVDLTDGGEISGRHVRLLDAVLALPGVEAVGAVTALPLTLENALQQPINPVQDHVSPEGEFISRRIRAASPGYFEAMGIPLLAGRVFETADHLDAAAVAIVSERMADEFWPGRDPLGLTIMDSIRVVGVVGDVKDVLVTAEAPPIAYFPLRSAAWNANLSFLMHHVVRTTGDPMEVREAVRDELRRIAPEAPMFAVTTMDRIVAESIDTFTFAERMMALAAGVALFLGTIGLYAVLAYSVRLRRGEIGLRMALGASVGDARWLVVRDGLTLALSGVAIGLVGAALATGVVSAMLFGVTPLDPMTYAVSVGVFLVVATLACLVPAAKAAGVPPSEVLRGE